MSLRLALKVTHAGATRRLHTCILAGHLGHMYVQCERTYVLKRYVIEQFVSETSAGNQL